MSAADFAQLIGVGVVVFASTNIDDIVLLALFFADPRFRARSVVAGQFLGIGVLTAASGIVAQAALVVPDGYPALLGVVPLALGIWKSRALFRKDKDDDAGEHVEQRRQSQLLSVALVTIANGADNIGVYVPLFAKAPNTVPFYAAVFAAMTAVWCGLGFVVVKNKIVGERIGRYGHAALPLVLIALGLFILKDALVLLD